MENLDLENAAAEAGCDLRLGLPDEGSTTWSPAPSPRLRHQPADLGQPVITAFQQADGAYLEAPELIEFVHSLEHGRIEIQYAPELPEADQLALKGVFDESPSGMLLFPNSRMPYEVAATAWTQLMGCKSYEGAKTLDAIRNFRDQFRGRGPEAVPVVQPVGVAAHSLLRFSSSPARSPLAKRGRDRRPEHDQHRQEVQRPEVPVGDVCERKEHRAIGLRGGVGSAVSGKKPESSRPLLSRP